MVVVNKRAPSLGGFKQELLAKEDIRLLIEAVETSEHLSKIVSTTRYEMLLGKLKRMEKQ